MIAPLIPSIRMGKIGWRDNNSSKKKKREKKKEKKKEYLKKEEEVKQKIDRGKMIMRKNEIGREREKRKGTERRISTRETQREKG